MAEPKIGGPYHAPEPDPRLDPPTLEEEAYWRDVGLGRQTLPRHPA